MRAPRPDSVIVKKRRFSFGVRFVVDVKHAAPGGRTRHRQKFKARAAAEAHARAIRRRLDAGLSPFETAQETASVTVLDVLEAYPQTPRGDQHIAAFRGKALAARSAEDFELADLEGFLVERGNLKTCAKDFSFLKRACAYAKAKGKISRHYFEKLAGDKVTRRRLMPAYNPKRDSAGREISDENFEAIFAHLAKDARRAVLFARTTGCRKREVASLDWRAHWSPEGFRPLTQKGSAPRVVAYDPAILGPRRPGGVVFGELGSSVAEIYQRLTAAWRYAVKAAKVPHYRFHDLRHTYGTILRRRGMTFSDIAAVMGISEAMAHVYAHEDTEKIQIEAIKLGTIEALSTLAGRA